MAPGHPNEPVHLMRVSIHAASGSELSKEFGPWNPGVTSDLSSELLALRTIFREENAFTTLTAGKRARGSDRT
jgi:hypothetical protein